MWDPVWEDVFNNQAWGKYPAEELIRFVARNFYKAPDRARVRFLELGCGPGANLWFLAREGFGFVGIDGSPAAIRQAEAHLDAECPRWRDRGELRVGDVSRLDFAEASFDAVIDNECVYCSDWDSALAIYAEARRVLRPEGRIYVRTFARGSAGDGSGQPAGHHAFVCDTGPLQHKGRSRFTDADEIPQLLAGFADLGVELLTMTHDAGRSAVKEWIVTARKPVSVRAPRRTEATLAA